MAKIERGRLDSVAGMRKFSAAELYLLAESYDAQLRDPANTDDPKWLGRRRDRIRKLAQKKEEAIRAKIAGENVPHRA